MSQWMQVLFQKPGGVAAGDGVLFGLKQMTTQRYKWDQMGLSEKHIPRTIYGRLNAKMMIDQWVRGLPHFQRQTPRIRFDVVT